MSRPATMNPGNRTRQLFLAVLAVLFVDAFACRDCAAAPAGSVEFGDFALLVPTDADRVRGLLLLLGGPDTRAFVSDGSFGAPDPELEASLHRLGRDLRALAADHGLAMLGTSRHGPNALPDQLQSDALIFEAIGEAARISGHDELAGAPILVYGISGGAPQAAGLAARNPDRVGALLLKVPMPPQRLDRAEALAVPTFMILAEYDAITDNQATLATFAANRRAGGLWGVAVEPGVPHHSLTANHRALTMSWLHAIIERRLGVSVQDPLQDIPESAGWLGHPDVGVADWAGYPGDRRAASWFPARDSAVDWWKFSGHEDVR